MILEYLPYIITAIILIVGFICYVINQKKSIKEWLLLAVTEAEKTYGSHTGKIKLRQVFEEFIKLFPIFSKFVTFTRFSTWVDIALDSMKTMLVGSRALQKYVGSETAVKGDEDGLGSSEQPKS